VWSSVDKLSDECVYDLTGFKTVDAARNEYDVVGGDVLFSRVPRHSAMIDMTMSKPALDHLLRRYPDLQEELQEAAGELFAEMTGLSQPKRNQGRRKKVDDFHLFLIPLITVHSGFAHWVMELVPGIRISRTHFSTLLQNATPIVVEKWVPRWYTRRSVTWLKKYCGGCFNGQNFDILLFVDAFDLRIEKSGDMLQQAMYYSDKIKTHATRSVVVSNAQEWIIFKTSLCGTAVIKFDEVPIFLDSGFLDDLETAISDEGNNVSVGIVADRAYYDLGVLAENWPKNSKMSLSVFHPHFIQGVPGKRGRPSKKQEAQRLKRKHLDKYELDFDRKLTSVRWVIEKAIGAVQHSRFFQNRVELPSLHLADDYLSIACAQANYKKDVPLE